jgi:hypothetical protein
MKSSSATVITMRPVSFDDMATYGRMFGVTFQRSMRG